MRNIVTALAVILLGLVFLAGPSAAGDSGGEKRMICHPVNGKGETGVGYNLISSDPASSHIDESKYPNGVYWQHMSNDGLRHDVYADNGQCPSGNVPDDPDAEDASASVSTSPATCEVGETLVYGAIQHATFEGTANGTQGPGSYSVTATAADGHAFPGGDKTKVFEGSLAGPLTGDQCAPPPEPCPDGDWNGDEPGCGEQPDPCPGGDFNGPNESGCGQPPEPCPDGDWNGDEPGCGEQPDPCPGGDFNGPNESGCGQPPQPPQPPAVEDQRSGSENSCELGGTLVWTETTTTPYEWDDELGEWVLGEPSVMRDEEFEPWSEAKYNRLCSDPDVAGEEEEKDPPTSNPPASNPPGGSSGPEVKGEQAAVPTAVDAGLAGAEPASLGRNPLWLAAFAGGLVLMGFAGTRRRAGVRR